MEKEVLKLFKGFIGKNTNNFSPLGLSYGLLIPSSANKNVIEEAIKLYGKDKDKWNQSFHKSFDVVKNSTIEELMTTQLLHYFSTYGLESLGIDKKDFIYIPKEKLEIPKLEKDIELIVIHPLEESEVKEKLFTLITSGIALSEDTIKDIISLAKYIDKNHLNKISNKEVKIALYDYYHLVPENEEEFLRYLLYRLTDSTLKIQNDEMIEMIRLSDRHVALLLMKNYLDSPIKYQRLSSIFLRNKRIFLALKQKVSKKDIIEDKEVYLELNRIINRLRKLAKKYHQPLKRGLLDSLTLENTNIDYQKLEKELNHITIFKEVRILNGLMYRLKGEKYIVYSIRNGRVFVAPLKKKNSDYDKKLTKTARVIKDHLVKRLYKRVKGKTIYIPDSIVYAFPVSEKKFMQDITIGSYLELPREHSLIYGVYWKNVINEGKEERVDLDLKQMNRNQVFGWDGLYQSNDLDILFSGDMTSAPLPQGASELFYVNKKYTKGAFLITLNMFTYHQINIPYEFVIAKAKNQLSERKYYVLDPNDIIIKLDKTMKCSDRQEAIGTIAISDKIRFFFNHFSFGRSNVFYSTSSNDEKTIGALAYLQNFNKYQLKLNKILIEAGANIVNTLDEKVDIDLSLNKITKDNIIGLLKD